MGTDSTTDKTARMQRIHSELVSLYAELGKLQARALPLVEEIENELRDILLRPEAREMFVAMRQLITKVR